MDIQINSVKITNEEAEIAITLSDIASKLLSEVKREGSYSFGQKLIDKIACIAAESYFENHKATLMESIDFDKLVNAVKVKIVEGFSLNR